MLSKNFAESEFRCPDCGITAVVPLLVEALQELRDVLGTPIHINSGYRCPAHNKAVGGAKHSMHLGGLAADCVFPGHKLFDVYLEAVRIEAFRSGGVGIYPPWSDDDGKSHGNFMHLDVRKRPARWGRYHGKYIPFDEALNILEK